MKLSLIVPEWLQIEQDTRRKLINQFAIPKSGVTEVQNSQLVCDGVTEKDLKTLDIGKMIQYIGEDLPFYRDTLFNELLTLTIKKINGENIKDLEKGGQSVEETTTNKGTKGRNQKKKSDIPSVA